jgi:hypothetical protein
MKNLQRAGTLDFRTILPKAHFVHRAQSSEYTDLTERSPLANADQRIEYPGIGIQHHLSDHILNLEIVGNTLQG